MTQTPDTDWIARVKHDLVKYLEMMPRSLDWDRLEDDDAEILYEAIFETRVAREGTQTALSIWRARRAELSAELAEAPWAVEIDEALTELEELAAPLEDGGLGGVDLAAVRERIFLPGRRLGALTDES